MGHKPVSGLQSFFNGGQLRREAQLHVDGRDADRERSSPTFLDDGNIVGPVGLGGKEVCNSTSRKTDFHRLLIQLVVHVHTFGEVVSPKNNPVRIAAAVLRACHLDVGMVLVEVFPIGAMESGIRGVHLHCVATSSLVYGFQHDVVPPGSTTPLLLAEPGRDQFVRNAVMVRAVRVQGVEVAFGRAHDGYVVVELARLSVFDSSYVVAFGLKFLLGGTDLVLDQHPYAASIFNDSEQKITFAVSVRKAMPSTRR